MDTFSYSRANYCKQSKLHRRDVFIRLKINEGLGLISWRFMIAFQITLTYAGSFLLLKISALQTVNSKVAVIGVRELKFYSREGA